MFYSIQAGGGVVKPGFHKSIDTLSLYQLKSIYIARMNVIYAEVCVFLNCTIVYIESEKKDD